MKKGTQRIFAAVAATLFTQAALAEEAVKAVGNGDKGLIAISVGLAIGIAALGGALGQGKALAAGLEGIARNPAARDKLFMPLIIGLVFIESLVLYALLLGFLLNAHI